AKKLVQESRNRKKNTDSSAGFHLKQLNLSVYFFSYWLVFAQPHFCVLLSFELTLTLRHF
ncbi:hypothetical protein ACTGXZ_05930, partial [Streptococcus suis]